MPEEKEQKPNMGFRNRKRADEFELSEEVAEDILAIFLDFYNIYPEDYETQGERRVYFSYCAKLLKAIRLGKLKIEKKEETINVVHVLRSGAELFYREMTNEAKLIDAGAREADENETLPAAMSRRYCAVMGFLSGAGYDAMKKLKAEDIVIMEALGFLLLNM